jgi:hypothetical protein
MQCCAWQHTAFSLLILLNEHSAVVDRSPFAAAVPPFPPLLCLLFCVVLTVLGRLSLTTLGRPLPIMMCITNTRRPPFEDSRDYEDSGLDRAPKTTEFVHVSDQILALWIPRMKYVVTSRVALLLPLTFAMPRRDLRGRNMFFVFLFLSFFSQLSRHWTLWRRQAKLSDKGAEQLCKTH